MTKKILFLLVVFTSLLSTAQTTYTVSGKMLPKQDYKWLILYQVKGVKQVFKGNADLDEKGSFSIDMKENAEPGIYRLFYDMEKNLYLDFIFNNENVEVTFNPLKPERTAKYITSNENKLFLTYQKAIIIPQQEADSLQIAVFNATNTSKKLKLSSAFSAKVNRVNKIQQKFEDNSKGTLAHFFIKSSKYEFPKTPYNNFKEYYNGIKDHYFDNVDFTDKRFLNSNFLINKVTDFVLYLSSSDDLEIERKLRKEAIAIVLDKVQQNTVLKKQLLTSLMYTFVQTQDIVIVDHLVNLYRKLPFDMQDHKIVNQVVDSMRLAIGRKAPDFSWYDGQDKINLSTVDTASYYIVTFWSTTCPHCLKEIPKLHDYVKDKEAIKVIAVALEDQDANYFDFRDKFTAFTNVLGLKKWKNDIAVKYEVHSTPNYFIVDNEHKTIVAKPYDLKELKSLFVQLPKEEKTKKEVAEVKKDDKK